MGPRTRTTTKMKAVRAPKSEINLMCNSYQHQGNLSDSGSDFHAFETSTELSSGEESSDFAGFDTPTINSPCTNPVLYHLNEEIDSIEHELIVNNASVDTESLSNVNFSLMPLGLELDDHIDATKIDFSKINQDICLQVKKQRVPNRNIVERRIQDSTSSSQRSSTPLCAIEHTQGNFLNFFSQEDTEVIDIVSDEEDTTVESKVDEKDKDPILEPKVTSVQAPKIVYGTEEANMSPSGTDQLCFVAVEIPVNDSSPEVITLDSPEESEIKKTDSCNASVATAKRNAEESPSKQPPTKKVTDFNTTESTLDYHEPCPVLDNVMKICPIVSFTCRDEELWQISCALNQQDSSHQINIAVTGPPGVGKSELVIAFLDKNTQKYDNIFWIDASTKEKLENDIQNLANKLKLSRMVHYKPINYTLLMNKVYNTFKTNNIKILLVFDNVDKPGNITKILPPASAKSNNVQILVTSQNTEWMCDFQLTVNYFSPENALQFLTQYLPDNENLLDIVQLLGNTPFALQSAVSYINHKQKIHKFKNEQYTIKDFIKELEENSNLFFNFKIQNIEVGNHYKLCLEKLKDDLILEKALLILNLLSFLESNQNPVKTLSSYGNEEEYLEALLALKENSLIDHENNMIILNPLFKLYVKSNCKNPIVILNILLAIVTKSLEANHDQSTIEQAMQLWAQASQYDMLIENFSTLATKLVTSNLIPNEKKLQFTETYIDSLEKALGWKNQNFLQIQTERAFMLYKTEQYEKCSMLCNTILKLDISDFKDNFYYFILSLKSKSLEALKQLEEVFEFNKHHYLQIIDMKGMGDEKAQEILRLMCNVAFKLYTKHKCDSWTEALFTLVENRTQDMNSNFEHTLEITNDIAECLIENNNEDKALLFYDKLYEITAKKYRPDHCNTLKSLFSKALCLEEINRFNEAWDVLLLVYTQQNITKQNSDETLLKMCEISCKSDNVDMLKIWLSTVKNKMKEVNDDIRSILSFTEEASILLDSENKRTEALLLYDQLQTNIILQHGEMSPQSLESLIAKAQFLCEINCFDDAWNIIIHISQLQCSPLIHKPNENSIILDVLTQLKNELNAVDDIVS